MPEQARLVVTIHGYVQGVGFRFFVRQHALALGLTGYVRNQRDGTVYVVAEGERSRLQQLVERLQRGPSEAEVQRVDINWQPATGEFSRFDVRL